MMMKLAVVVSLVSILSMTSAFVPSSSVIGGRSTMTTTTVMGMVPSVIMTGPAGKPAKSKEEDLELTTQIILDYVNAQNTDAGGGIVDDDEE